MNPVAADMAFIRPYKVGDEEACLYVFRETAAPDLRAHPDPDVLHVGSYLWCRPYIVLAPGWCWVLDDGTGKAVGYILCAPNTPEFVKSYRHDFLTIVKEHGLEQPVEPLATEDLATQFRSYVFHPEMMLQSDFPTLVEQYPAHLHIDILPSHQGQEWGQKMIATLLGKLREEKVPGVHLGMAATNHRAGKFYDRLGFERFKEMNEQGELGRKGGAVYRVKKTEQGNAA